MTPSVPPVLPQFLRGGGATASETVGVVVLVVILTVLAAKSLLQSSTPSPRLEALRILDLVATPLLIVFILIVLERFRDLS
jgi:hypothetical protein